MYKFYENGKEFLDENNEILKKYPLETVFFELNAKFIDKTDNNDFLFKLVCGDKYLIAVHNKDFPVVIFGDIELCAEFAEIAVNSGLTFGKVLGGKVVCEAFLQRYQSLTGVVYSVNHAMDIMRCNNVLTSNVDGVEQATTADVSELAKLIAEFQSEAMGETVSAHDKEKDVLNNLSNFALVRQDGKIASLASKSRETDTLTAISNVYTLPQYRCKGLSCKIVTYLTKQVVDIGKLAYLFVDKTNPISNHLYQKIGYTYATPQYEYKLHK